MIRNATIDDIQSILDIYNDAIEHTTAVYTYQKQTLSEKLEWFKQKEQDQFPVIVFTIQNRVVGFATYGSFRAWPAYKYTIEHSIYVDKEYRNQGIASALLKALINLAKEAEYKTIVAGIDADNAGSIHLHEKFGFHFVGNISSAGYKFGKWLDLAFYQLLLDGPNQPNEDERTL